MKKRYYFITAIAAYLLILLATIPAKPITELINDNTPVAIAGVSGTLWDGQAYLIRIDNNIQLDETRWSFNLWKLLIGQLSLNIDTSFLGETVTAEAGSSFLGRVFINDLRATVSASEVTTLTNIPIAKLDGPIILDIQHAQWKQGELPLASGSIKWNDASVTVAETASLGNVLILLSESDQQLLNAEIKNNGGDISISGNAELIAEADYAADITLVPNASASKNIRQSLGMFARRQPNGEYNIKKSGPLSSLGLM
jgi:general secretion pathway protein N